MKCTWQEETNLGIEILGMAVIYKSKWFWQETIVIPPFRNIGTRIGEAAQWLTALASLSKNSGSLSSTHMVSHKYL